MKHLDLFSGIGGMAIGMNHAGIGTAAFVEIDPFCRTVLRAHWPEAPIYGDIRDFDAARVGPVDIVTGGFPCQPVSAIGKHQGEDDERWLWPEMLRVVREAQSRWVLVENVIGLLSADTGRIFGGIIRDLAALGYVGRWDCIPAAALGAPHRRDRVWILAHQVAHPRRELLEGWLRQPAQGATQWATEPDVGRVADGVPARVDRLRSLGNAVVPAIPELYGRVIYEHEAEGWV